MPFELPFGYRNLNPNGSSNVDSDYGYYNSIPEALSAISPATRKGGRTVGIKDQDTGEIVEYWWRNDNDLSDAGLVEKNVSGNLVWTIDNWD